MKVKNVISLIVFLAVTMFSCMSVFAKEKVKVGGSYYLFDDNDNICKNTLYDEGIGAYYFGEDGKMVTSWFKHPKDKTIYFFINDPNNNYGAMLFGFYYIDGYLRHFDSGGIMSISDSDRMQDVLGKYTVDSNGFLYDMQGNLMRDTSEKRSDFYTDSAYYKDTRLNNKTLAESGKIGSWDGEKIIRSAEDIKRYKIEQSLKAKEIFNSKANDNTNVVVSGAVK